MTKEIPKWVSDYVNIPFDTCNCWQLVCKIYKEQFGKIIPAYENEYKSSTDKNNIKKIYDRELQIWKRLNAPVLGCVIVCKIKNQPWHAGIVVSRDSMLHTEKDLYSVIERFNGLVWKNKIIGFYRYNENG
jgi:cell wall-associated NlpC family hydrolase